MTKGDSWQPQGLVPALDAGRVYVWRVFLDQDGETTGRLAALLSEDEHERAERFYFPYLRTRFIAARAALRLIAGAVSDRPAAGIEFAYAQHGKPYLAESRVRFNISHAHQLALIAFSLDRELGVDIEHLRPLPDGESIARRFFSYAEVNDFLAADEDQREVAFFNGWTRKEAYIKALGDGLAYPLNQFRVTLKPGAPARLLAVYPKPGEVERWRLEAIDPGEGYIGALLAEGQEWELEQLDFKFPARGGAAE